MEDETATMITIMTASGCLKKRAIDTESMEDMREDEQTARSLARSLHSFIIIMNVRESRYSSPIDDDASKI